MFNATVDLLAVVLPTVIAVISVYIGIIIAKNREHRYWWWTVIALGVVTSGVTYLSQSNARTSHNEDVNGLNGQLEFMRGQLAQEKDTLNTVTSRLSTAIAQGQQQFALTASGLTHNIDAILGGKTFCYVTASDVGKDFIFIVMAKGKDPLHDLNMEMVDLDMQQLAVKSSPDWETMKANRKGYPIVPGLVSSSGRIIDQVPIGTGDSRNFAFTFFAINGTWSEVLRLRRVNGVWTQALRVWKERPSSGKPIRTTLYEIVDPRYPKVNGAIDWP